MSKLYIYAIQLEENKHFIHCDKIERDYTQFTDEKIMRRCELLNDYTKKYRPLSVTNVDSMSKFDNFLNKDSLYSMDGSYYLPELADMFSAQYALLVDFYVKKYMVEFGIDAVRGGTYSEEILCDYLQTSLILELQSVSVLNNNITFLDDIENKISILEKNAYVTDKKEYVESLLEKYYVSKEKYEDIVFFNVYDEQWKLGSHIIKEIQWLETVVETVIKNDIESDVTQNKRFTNLNDGLNKVKCDRYEKLLIYIKRLMEVYDKYYGKIEDSSGIYLYHPEFILDKYIYHSALSNFYIGNKDRMESEVRSFLENIEGIYYSIKNRLDELEFDVKSFNVDFEKEIKTILWNFSEKLESIK